MNKSIVVLIVALVSIIIGCTIVSFDMDTRSNIKIIELQSEIKILENQLIAQNATNVELEKINIELLLIPDYLRSEYQNESSEKFITAKEFLEKREVKIPTIFTAAIKGEIKDNSIFTVYGQVPYGDSTITGTIFRGNINNAAIIDISQVTSNEYGQYSFDVAIKSGHLWKVGEYLISIQNEGVFKELKFTLND